MSDKLKIVSDYKLQWCIPEASEQSCIQAFERLQILQHKKFLNRFQYRKHQQQHACIILTKNKYR